MANENIFSLYVFKFNNDEYIEEWEINCGFSFFLIWDYM